MRVKIGSHDIFTCTAKKKYKQTELLSVRKSYEEKNTVHEAKLNYLIKLYIYYQNFQFNHVNDVNIVFLFCNLI